MSGTKFQCHIQYVALSRVTSLNGLCIRSLDPSKINVDPYAVKKMNELRTTRATHTCMSSLHPTKYAVTILHQNVRSFQKHMPDIQNGKSIVSICLQNATSQEKKLEKTYK